MRSHVSESVACKVARQMYRRLPVSLARATYLIGLGISTIRYGVVTDIFSMSRSVYHHVTVETSPPDTYPFGNHSSALPRTIPPAV